MRISDWSSDVCSSDLCSVTVARAHAAATATAGIAIVEGGLSRIAVAMRIARRSRGVVAQNLALAIGYNLIAVPIALAGGMTPLIAAIAMTGSPAGGSRHAMRGGDISTKIKKERRGDEHWVKR